MIKCTANAKQHQTHRERVSDMHIKENESNQRRAKGTDEYRTYTYSNHGNKLHHRFQGTVQYTVSLTS